MNFNINMANNLSFSELKNYLNDISENSYMNLFHCARYYSMMKDFEKANDILYKLLDINDNISYNARNQLICNANICFDTKTALELIKINENIMNDVDLKNQKCYAMYLNDEFDDNILSLLDTFEKYSNNWRNHCTMVSQYYYSIGDFKKGLEYHVNSLHIFDKFVDSKDIVIRVPNCGIGDEIVLLRLLPILTKRGYNVKWSSERKDIIDIVHNMGYETSNSGNFVNGYDIMHQLCFDYNDIMIEPYIKPSLNAISKFKDCKGIGIRISGNDAALDEPMRKIPLDSLKKYLPNDVNHYSLHLENIDGLIHNELLSLDDTMGLIYNMDYVVTACTSIAHLSCAMGKKTFVLTKKCCWYTWRKYNGKLAWYNDNCHVIYQSELLNWDCLKELEGL